MKEPSRMSYPRVILCSLLIALAIVSSSFSSGRLFSIGAATDNKTILLLRYDFPQPAVTKIGNYHRITMGELSTVAIGGAGKPEMPVKEAKILLPPNAEIENMAVQGERIKLAGSYLLEPSSGAVPLCCEELKSIAADTIFYSSATEFPGALSSTPRLQGFRGYSILLLNLYPLQYIPKTGELYYYSELELSVSLSFRAQEITELYRGFSEDRSQVMQIVDNPEILSYYETLPNKGLKASVRYLIITDANLVSAFNPLVDWRTQRGISTAIETVQNITNNYTGADTQEKIRNYIKDKYLSWGVEYVLLGADDELLPHRGFYVDIGDVSDEDIPCDLYYGGLDGTWNTDGDSYWAEPGEEDYYAEVYVGRAPVNTVTEAQTFVNKLKSFEGSARSKNITLHGNVVDNHGTTTRDCKEGGLETDVPLENRVGVRYYLPTDYAITPLYDSGTGAVTINKTIWENQWKEGRLIINHGSHGNVEEYYINYQGTKISYTDTSAYALTNSYYPIHLTIACYTGSFDGRNPPFPYGSGGYVSDKDCLAEEFIINPGGGCSACIMNSRFGLYGGQNKPIKFSGELDVQFYNKTFNLSIPYVGKALQLTREHFAPLAAQGTNNGSDYDAYRWVVYTWNLLGDPIMELVIFKPPENDVGIEHVNISEEVSGIYYTGPHYINATVKNYGNRSQEPFNVSCEIAEIVGSSEIVVFNNTKQTTGVMAQNDTQLITWSYEFKEQATYRINVRTLLGSDEKSANNLGSVQIDVKFLIAVTEGWNLVALPYFPKELKASELANNIPYCSHIKRFDSELQVYETYTKGTPASDFYLEKGSGYFVYVTQSSKFYINGSKASVFAKSLKPGWNLLGAVAESTTKASYISSTINYCSAIAYWDKGLGRFVIHIPNTAVGDFDIERTDGFAVYVASKSSWVNRDWSRRRAISINNSANPNTLTEYQLKLSIPYDSDMNSDFSDLRFVDYELTTELPYWLENYVASSSANVWIKVPRIEASTTTTIYMYYGNPNATSISDPDSVFILYDNFEKDKGWSYYETVSQLTGGYATDQYFSPIQSYKLQLPGGSSMDLGNYTEIYKIITLSSLDSINISVYNRGYNDGGSSAEVYMRVLVNESIIISNNIPSGTSTVAWTLRTGTYAPSSLTIKLQLRLYFNDSGTKWAERDCWWDDIMVRKHSAQEPSCQIGSEEIAGT
ncbi:MAG: DUF2341 domain-containing protein [Candidatus Thermoplasmatota archaeon]|nr:DUF2341 domain-containing protein [Candidatus Thermoplasmatota archaeon]